MYSLFIASEHLLKIILSTHLLACAGKVEIVKIVAMAIKNLYRIIDENQSLTIIKSYVFLVDQGVSIATFMEF